MAYFLAHAQVKVNSSKFGAIEARALGPGTMSGRITAIKGVNKDGKTLYVDTAGGGIWNSTNTVAIALGHPVGMTGARILLTASRQLNLTKNAMLYLPCV